MRRERRLEVKRLRNKLQRVCASCDFGPATIHKVLSAWGSASCRLESGVVTCRSVTNAPFPAIGCRWVHARSGLASANSRRSTIFLVAGLARRRLAGATSAFLYQALEEMPFSIQRDAAFLAEEVQRRLMGEAIRFRPNPARSPRLNRKVVRAQRTVLEEFCAMVDPKAAG